MKKKEERGDVSVHHIEQVFLEKCETDKKQALNKIKFWKRISIAVLVMLVINLFFDISISIRPRFDTRQGQRIGQNKQQLAPTKPKEITLEESVLPSTGVVLPIRWGSLGKQMSEIGVIDSAKFEAVYAQRGGLDSTMKQLLSGPNNGAITMNAQNSGIILNLLWAFGLSNKNAILEQGPMSDPQYGGANRFASTGGWTLSKGDVMTHYSAYQFVVLTPEQQALVENVSKNIYRPCCGNSVYFPDCNHGMAMLGLLELMASQGATEAQMYKTALIVNSYWFPDTYLTIAKYFAKQGKTWAQVDPKEALSAQYSSGQGYRKILTEVEPSQPKGGGGCAI